ncbi:coiled-coil domain-containing protein 173 [Hypomesus transpacificus]|uniref:coiled-coil domain-containing protein 173 n=1 Tax=Hypomesus transpacificus TaxID=137520 RepID=UPI001F076353|nr:coiled-coil domain-containing protein 173 [Hypomesus transpacificus]
MATASAVQYGRRRGSSKKMVEGSETLKPLDLRQVTVLPKAEWLRIQGSLNRVNTQNESLKEASRQREEMHLRSKEVVKFWSNTIAGQRQKKLEAKKIRDEIEEEEKKKVDIEEAKYQEEKRKEAIVKAKAQQYYQTDRVKGFHSALMLTEVLKEREAQIELKQRKLEQSKDVDREAVVITKHKDKEASKQEMEKAVRRKLESQAVAEALKQQAKEHEMARERERLEEQREAEEIQRLKNLFLLDETMKKQKNLEEKKHIMRDHMDHLSNRDIIRAIEAQQQEVEDKRRKMFAAAKEKMMKLRKEKEAEMLREVQIHKDRITEDLAKQYKEQEANEEEIIAKAVAEQESKLETQQKEKAEKKALVLDSIASHREAMRKDHELRARESHQEGLDMLYAKREADRIFLEKQHLKAQKTKEDGKVLQSHHIHQMAEKLSQTQLLRKELEDLENMNARLVAEEEKQFQQYAQQVMEAAAQAQRNILPLRKAAREGLGGGQGPVVRGVRPSYLVQDDSGVQMPTYVSESTMDMKELNEATDIQKSKKRLGFTF